MAEGSLRSVSDADEQLNTAGRLFSLILVLVACTALSFFLCFIAPAGIAVFSLSTCRLPHLALSTSE